MNVKPYGSGMKQKQDLTQQLAEANAHIERLRDAIRYSSEYLDDSNLNSIGSGSKAHNEMLNALKQTPAQSLQEVEVQTLEEAAEAVYNQFNKWGKARIFLNERAQQIKQQGT